MWKNLKRQVWRYPGKAAWFACESICIVCYFAFFFYRSIWGLLPLLPVGAVFFIKQCRRWEEKKRKEMEKQFQQCILAVAAGLRAGYSVEHAFCGSIGEMKLMFGEGSSILTALEFLAGGMKNNIPLEQLLHELAVSSGSPFISEFAEIFEIAGKSGGNLTELIVDAVETMNMQLRTEEDIQDIISGRKFEQKVMSMVPFLIITYIDVTNRGYFDVLYHNIPGVLFMTVCLAVYLTAYVAAEKIADISPGEGT